MYFSIHWSRWLKTFGKKFFSKIHETQQMKNNSHQKKIQEVILPKNELARYENNCNMIANRRE
jgi:hypothetical protein